MEKIKLSELFDFNTIFNGYGLFSMLYKYITINNKLLLFVNKENCGILDADYHIGHSGDKFISPLLYKSFDFMLNAYGYTWEEILNDISKRNAFYQDSETAISSLIYNHYYNKWNKVYEVMYNAVYNPIHNYSMDESNHIENDKIETFNNVKDERIPDLTTSGLGNTKTGIYGFNGNNPKDSNVVDSDTEEKLTGKDTNVKSGSINNDDIIDETKHKEGNIGVTSTQDMINQEWELRQRDFIEMVFKDLDNLLCLKIY